MRFVARLFVMTFAGAGAFIPNLLRLGAGLFVGTRWHALTVVGNPPSFRALLFEFKALGPLLAHAGFGVPVFRLFALIHFGAPAGASAAVAAAYWWCWCPYIMFLRLEIFDTLSLPLEPRHDRQLTVLLPWRLCCSFNRTRQ